MDVRDSAYIIAGYRKRRLQNILDIADAAQVAIFSGKSPKGFKTFEKWHRRIERKINPAPEKTMDIWDRIVTKGKSKRIN